MNFAQPLFLLFFSLFIPVVLLYLLKQRRRPMHVATLLFWERVLKDEQTTTSINQMKKWLSLLLQLLFITLLALALSRPLLGDWVETRRIVLLLDTSASMMTDEDGTTRFELARETAHDVIDGLAMGDTLMLVVVGEEPTIVHPFTDNKRDLLARLDAISCSHEASHFQSAFDLLQHLPPDPRETVAYVITDGAFEPVPFTPPEDMRFAYLPVGSQTDNVGITAFQVRPLPMSSQDLDIYIELTNESDDEVTVPLDLSLNGNLINAYEITIPARGHLQRIIEQMHTGPGVLQASIIHDDAFALDNVAATVLPPSEPLAVRLITTGDFFLESALITNERFSVTTVLPEEYVDDASFSVTIFSGWTPERFPTGNSIFIAQWPGQSPSESQRTLENPILNEWEHDHPVLQHVTLQNVTIEQGISIPPEPGDVSLVRSFDDTVVMLRESESYKALLIGFPTLSSNLPMRVAFPIMITNAIDYLAGREPSSIWESHSTGETVSVADLGLEVILSATQSIESASWTIEAPDGAHIAELTHDDRIALSLAGVYSVLQADDIRIPIVASMLNAPRESNIAPAEALPIESDTPIEFIEDGFRLGSEPWVWLAIAALVLSVTEWILFHRRWIE